MSYLYLFKKVFYLCAYLPLNALENRRGRGSLNLELQAAPVSCLMRAL